MDWVGNLRSQNVNQNFECLNDIINKTMDEVAPRHTVRVSAKRRFVEPWMTSALEHSAKKSTVYIRKHYM